VRLEIIRRTQTRLNTVVTHGNIGTRGEDRQFTCLVPYQLFTGQSFSRLLHELLDLPGTHERSLMLYHEVLNLAEAQVTHLI